MKYRDRNFQLLYDNLLVLARNPSSELYYKGQQHRGASHRCAFWDGFSGHFTFTGPKRSAHVIPGTLSAVCFMAGRTWATEQKKIAKTSATITT